MKIELSKFHLITKSECSLSLSKFFSFSLSLSLSLFGFLTPYSDGKRSYLYWLILPLVVNYIKGAHKILV